MLKLIGCCNSVLFQDRPKLQCRLAWKVDWLARMTTIEVMTMNLREQGAFHDHLGGICYISNTRFDRSPDMRDLVPQRSLKVDWEGSALTGKTLAKNLQVDSSCFRRLYTPLRYHIDIMRKTDHTDQTSSEGDNAVVVSESRLDEYSSDTRAGPCRQRVPPNSYPFRLQRYWLWR